MIKNEFEWDDNKNESNKKKHGIDFNDAKEVFKDKDSKIEDVDLRKDYDEERRKIVGKIKKIIIAVIYTFRGIAIRIISARSASRKERKEYNSKNKTQNENENEK